MEEHIIEMRSDTFTKPTPEMYEAMVKAEVGDAVYDEDPTTNELQKKVAEMFGKEAAIFMATGTMANLTAVMSHCWERGSDMIVGNLSHYNLWEQGGPSQIAGVYVKQIENNQDGTFDLEKFKTMISDYTDCHCSRTRLVCIENTHNQCGGRILPVKFVDDLKEICQSNDIKIHLDGARILNAAVASNVPVKELTKNVDSINMCFSKGLGTPIGSILVGSQDFIKRAKRVRKVLGGSMRQTGVIAAACLYGLSKAEENFRKDHENAKKLAEGIEGMSSNILTTDAKKVETNIVHVTVLPKSLNCQKVIERLKTVTEQEKSDLNARIIVNGGEADSRTIRFLTHLNVSSADIELALKKISYVCKEYSKIIQF